MFGRRKKLDSKELGRRLAAYSGSAADQRNWQRWLSVTTRTWHDLELVVKGGAMLAFRVRALTALMLWDHALDPFAGRAMTAFSGSSQYASRIRVDMESRLADVAAVIVNFCLEAIDEGATSPEGARDRYNQCIPALLENIQDASLGDELFKRFQPHDTGTPSPDNGERSNFTITDYAFFSRGKPEEW